MNRIKKSLANWTTLHSAVSLMGFVLIVLTVIIALTKPGIKASDAVCSIAFAVGLAGFLLFMVLTGNTEKTEEPKSKKQNRKD